MPKRGGGAQTVCRLKGGLSKKEGRELDTPIHTIYTKSRSYNKQMFNYRRRNGKMPMLLVSEVLLKILNKIQVVVS